MVRPIVARILSGDYTSLRNCSWPLASGLRLQPGHDEVRASCFQIASSGTKPAFGQDLQNADRLFRHHFRALQLNPVGTGYWVTQRLLQADAGS